jgi:hypothetical protein
MLKDDNHIKTKQLVDEILKTEPDYLLPEDFAEKMATRFEKSVAWKLYFNEFLIYLTVGVGIIGTTVAMFIFLMSKTWAELVKWLGSNIPGLIGIAIILIFILFTDRVLLRYFFLKTKQST